MAAGIAKIDGFNTYAPHPTDKLRGKFTDITARDALSSNYRYEGLITYVDSTQSFYALIGGITNTDWVEIASANSVVKKKVTENAAGTFTGIEIGLNVFTNTAGTRDVVVQFKDANGNVLNLIPTITDTTISIVSGVTYVGAELIIL